MDDALHEFDFDLAITHFIDGSIGPDELAELNIQLRNHPAQRSAFVRRCRIIGELYENVAAEETETQLPILEKIEPALDVSTAPASRAVPRPGPRPLTQTVPSHKFRFPTWTYATAAALLIAAAALVVYLITNNPDPNSEIRNPQLFVALAEITHTDSGVENFNRQNYSGESLTYGNISITHGETDFILNNRVAVQMHGAGKMSLRDQMNVAIGSSNLIQVAVLPLEPRRLLSNLVARQGVATRDDHTSDVIAKARPNGLFVDFVAILDGIVEQASRRHQRSASVH